MESSPLFLGCSSFKAASVSVPSLVLRALMRIHFSVKSRTALQRAIKKQPIIKYVFNVSQWPHIGLIDEEAAGI